MNAKPRARFNLNRQEWTDRWGRHPRKLKICEICAGAAFRETCDNCRLSRMREIRTAKIEYRAFSLMTGGYPPLKRSNLKCRLCDSKATHWHHSDWRKPTEADPMCCKCMHRQPRQMTFHEASFLTSKTARLTKPHFQANSQAVCALSVSQYGPRQESLT